MIEFLEQDVEELKPRVGALEDGVENVATELARLRRDHESLIQTVRILAQAVVKAHPGAQEVAELLED